VYVVRNPSRCLRGREFSDMLFAGLPFLFPLAFYPLSQTKSTTYFRYASVLFCNLLLLLIFIFAFSLRLVTLPVLFGRFLFVGTFLGSRCLGGFGVFVMVSVLAIGALFFFISFVS